MSRKLFVGNLPYETMEQDLESLFGQAGQVETVTVMRDRMTGRPRGFAFVSMASDEEADKAVANAKSSDGQEGTPTFWEESALTAVRDRDRFGPRAGAAGWRE